MSSKSFVALMALVVVASVSARPQGKDDNPSDLNVLSEDYFDENPKYSYSYQVASEQEQTYITQQESRDGNVVTGEYSYVDPLGQLITVTYNANEDGYTESRTVKPNFITIRVRQPSPAALAEVPITGTSIAVTPIAAAGPSVPQGGSDIVSAVIQQLTPFIRDTVSTSLSGSTRQGGRVAAAASSLQPVVAARNAAPGGSSSSATASVFGDGGANNVRFQTKDFDFAYQLEKK